MQLRAINTLSERGQLIEPGAEFEIADAAGLVLIRDGDAEAVEAEDPDAVFSPVERAALAIVRQNAVAAIDAIEQVTDLDVLRAVGAAEDAGKQRTTVLAAVAARGEALTSDSTAG